MNDKMVYLVTWQIVSRVHIVLPPHIQKEILDDMLSVKSTGGKVPRSKKKKCKGPNVFTVTESTNLMEFKHGCPCIT